MSVNCFTPPFNVYLWLLCDLLSSTILFAKNHFYLYGSLLQRTLKSEPAIATVRTIVIVMSSVLYAIVTEKIDAITGSLLIHCLKFAGEGVRVYMYMYIYIHTQTHTLNHQKT